VNGCFWHGHERCPIYSTPKSNTEFWISKIERNRERDRRNFKDLQNAGWKVIVIWECQLKKTSIEATMHGVEHMLSQNLLEMYK
jgi:DNA mismatch endonuclease (patch repair protein)